MVFRAIRVQKSKWYAEKRGGQMTASVSSLMHVPLLARPNLPLKVASLLVEVPAESNNLAP